MLDSHLYWKNPLGIDIDTITWRRAVDLNDRALREMDLTLGRGAHRMSGFDITAALRGHGGSYVSPATARTCNGASATSSSRAMPTAPR